MLLHNTSFADAWNNKANDRNTRQAISWSQNQQTGTRNAYIECGLSLQSVKSQISSAIFILPSFVSQARYAVYGSYFALVCIFYGCRCVVLTGRFTELRVMKALRDILHLEGLLGIGALSYELLAIYFPIHKWLIGRLWGTRDDWQRLANHGCAHEGKKKFFKQGSLLVLFCLFLSAKKATFAWSPRPMLAKTRRRDKQDRQKLGLYPN